MAQPILAMSRHARNLANGSNRQASNVVGSKGLVRKCLVFNQCRSSQVFGECSEEAMQQHLADLASRDSNGHTRMMYHAAFLAQLLHPRHDDRAIAHANEERHDARPATPFREQPTAEYLGNGDNGRPGNSITYTIIPPSEEPNLTAETRVNMVALGASYNYGVVSGTDAARLWLIRALVPRTCCIGVGYKLLRTRTRAT